MSIDNFDPSALADLTEGLSGSDIRLVLREAVLEALSEDRTVMNQKDLVDAVAAIGKRDLLKNIAFE
jgi:ATP-dependent 26S proteasome regulatory subunit